MSCILAVTNEAVEESGTLAAASVLGGARHREGLPRTGILIRAVAWAEGQVSIGDSGERVRGVEAFARCSAACCSTLAHAAANATSSRHGGQQAARPDQWPGGGLEPRFSAAPWPSSRLAPAAFACL